MLGHRVVRHPEQDRAQHAAEQGRGADQDDLALGLHVRHRRRQDGRHRQEHRQAVGHRAGAQEGQHRQRAYHLQPRGWHWRRHLPASGLLRQERPETEQRGGTRDHRLFRARRRVGQLRHPALRVAETKHPLQHLRLHEGVGGLPQLRQGPAAHRLRVPARPEEQEPSPRVTLRCLFPHRLHRRQGRQPHARDPLSPASGVARVSARLQRDRRQLQLHGAQRRPPACRFR